MFLLTWVFWSVQYKLMLSHFPQQAEMEEASPTKFFLSLDGAWLLASSLHEELISVQHCKS